MANRNEVRQDNAVRTIPLAELRESEYYWDLADLAEIFHHEVIEDDNGTWRWKKNMFMCVVLDDAPWYEGDWGAHARVLRGSLSLNDIWGDLYEERFSLEEFVKFYMGIGYSLSGFCEVFGQRNVYDLPAGMIPEGYEVPDNNEDDDNDDERDENEEADNAPTLIDFLRDIHQGKVLWNL